MEENNMMEKPSEEHVIFIDRLVDFPIQKEREEEEKRKKEEKVEESK